jgi:hypothetical protein
MKENLKIIVDTIDKLDGDAERDSYIILSLFQKLGVEYQDISPTKAFYLYLCGLIEIILTESDSNDDYLTDDESELVDRIEEVIGMLEEFDYNY